MQIDDTIFIDEPRTNTSARRYQAVQNDLDPDQRREAQAILNNINIGTRRASRAAASSFAASNRKQQGRRSAQEPAPKTDDDKAIHVDLPRTQALAQESAPQLPRLHFRAHPLFWMGTGMISLLIAWMIGLQTFAWYINSFQNPLTYTQTAHMDTTTLIVDAAGHTEQARAFIDGQDHIDLLVIPNGDASKAHIIVGPLVMNIEDLQHRATIAVTANGKTGVTVKVQGQLEVNGLEAAPQAAQWSTDISQQPSSSQEGRQR
jgi:hypothetical protein